MVGVEEGIIVITTVLVIQSEVHERIVVKVF
jgi:hypothetical protein